MSDLTFADHVPSKPKEPPKPRIDVGPRRYRADAAIHSGSYIQGEVARFKKSFNSKGVTAGEALEKFADATETHWNEVVEAIDEKLKE